MGTFAMPSLGADMDRGTLLEWRVAPGDAVHRGDVIAVVDTEKSAVEVEVFETGVVGELLVEPGTEVEVGTALATIVAAAGEAPGRAAAAAEPTPAAPLPAPVASTAPAAVPGPGVVAHPEPAVRSPLVRHLADRLGVDTEQLAERLPGHHVTRADVEGAAARRAAPGGAGGGASPLARRRAAELGIDLAAVRGSGPGGAVRARDLAAAPAAGPTAAPARAEPMRQAIARLMATSNREIPHYHLSRQVDVEPLLTWLQERNSERRPDERVLLAAALLRATALAAARHRDLCGAWLDDAFVPADGVHLGVAISLRGGGLITPVIRDADQLDLDATMARLRELVGRVRGNRLRGSDLGGAALTVTDLGERGADSVLGVIHPPQVALVGFGGVVWRPWVVDGAVAPRRIVTSTLAGDHRATDGHVGSRFLATLADRLAHPDQL